MWFKNIAGRFFGLVTKHACDRQSDGRTDGENYESQDRASIAASRDNDPPEFYRSDIFLQYVQRYLNSASTFLRDVA